RPAKVRQPLARPDLFEPLRVPHHELALARRGDPVLAEDNYPDLVAGLKMPLNRLRHPISPEERDAAVLCALCEEAPVRAVSNRRDVILPIFEFHLVRVRE